MEWLFRKMIENPGESYSPQKVKQILDTHQIAIERLLIFIGFLCFAFALYVTTKEISFWLFKKKLKSGLYKKNVDKMSLVK